MHKIKQRYFLSPIHKKHDYVQAAYFLCLLMYVVNQLALATSFKSRRMTCHSMSLQCQKSRTSNATLILTVLFYAQNEFLNQCNLN